MNGKTNYLLPHGFQIAGWWGLLVSVAVFVFLLWGEICVSDFRTPPVILAWIPFLASLLLICVSREKVDDEYISMLRGRIVCVIVIAYVLIEILLLISDLVIICYGDVATVGILSYVNIILHPVCLMIIYAIAFRITLFVNNRKMTSYAEK